MSDLSAELAEAEKNLREWATGGRSNLSTMMSVENYVGDSSSTGPGVGPDRQATLIATAQADAAEVALALAKVQGLRALLGLTPEGDDPREIALWLVARS